MRLSDGQKCLFTHGHFRNDFEWQKAVTDNNSYLFYAPQSSQKLGKSTRKTIRNYSITEPSSSSRLLHLNLLWDRTEVLKKVAPIQNIGFRVPWVLSHSKAILCTTRAFKHYLKSRSEDLMPPCDFTVQFTKWTLINNVFLFLNELYRQENGTAMGVCLAPNYANSFLGLWKEGYTFSNQNPSKEKIVWWGRYFDGVI